MVSILKFGLKCAVVGGAIYTAVEVLDSPESLKSAFNQLQNKTSQSLLRVPVDVDISLPEVQTPSSALIKQEWNVRVRNVFASLDAAPDTIRNLSVQGYKQAKKLLQYKK